MMDIDESSVIVEINVGSFLSDVDIRFQSSFESNWDNKKWFLHDINDWKPDSILDEVCWLNNAGDCRDA